MSFLIAGRPIVQRTRVLAGTYSLVFGQPIFCFLKRERELGARDTGGHA